MIIFLLKFVVRRLALVLMVVGGCLFAAGFQEDYNQGEALFQKGDFVNALVAFKRACRENPGHAGVNFYLGRTAFELKDYETAAMAFDRALILDATLARVKLELGRTYYELGVYELARQYFGEVLKTQPPADVRRNIETFLSHMKPQRKSGLTGQLTLSMLYDTNAGVSPSNQMVGTSLGPVSLTGNAAGQDRALGGEARLYLDHLYRPVDAAWGWRTRLSNVGGRSYIDAMDADSQSFFLSSGPQFFLEESAERNRSLDLFGIFRHDDLDYRTLAQGEGLGLEYRSDQAGRVHTGDVISYFLGMHAQKVEYPNPPQRSAWSVLTFGECRYLLWQSDPPVWQLTLRPLGLIDYEDSTDDVWSYLKEAAWLRSDIRYAPTRTTLFGQYGIQHAKFAELDPLFTRQRKDVINDFSFGLRQELTPRLSFELKHTYTHSGSTQDLYCYNRYLTSLSVSYLF